MTSIASLLTGKKAGTRDGMAKADVLPSTLTRAVPQASQLGSILGGSRRLCNAILPRQIWRPRRMSVLGDEMESLIKRRVATGSLCK